MKDIKEHLKSINADEAEIATFEKGAQAYAKKVVANFKDYEFVSHSANLLVTSANY